MELNFHCCLDKCETSSIMQQVKKKKKITTPNNLKFNLSKYATNYKIFNSEVKTVKFKEETNPSGMISKYN